MALPEGGVVNNGISFQDIGILRVGLRAPGGLRHAAAADGSFLTYVRRGWRESHAARAVGTATEHRSSEFPAGSGREGTTDLREPIGRRLMNRASQTGANARSVERS